MLVSSSCPSPLGTSARPFPPFPTNSPPSWLAKVGKIEAAREALARTRGVRPEDAHTHALIVREADEMQNMAEYEAKQQSGWIDCFKPKDKILYRTLLGKHASSAGSSISGS